MNPGKSVVADCFDLEGKEIEISKVAIYKSAMVINWDIEGWFGITTIYKENERLYIDSECMGAEFVKKILCSVVDSAEAIE